MAKKFKYKSEKPKEKWRIFGCGDVDIETDMVNGTHIELFSNREITVEGCIGVFEYSDAYLRLRLNKGALILCGSGFDIASFEGSNITVKGKISSLEFCV